MVSLGAVLLLTATTVSASSPVALVFHDRHVSSSRFSHRGRETRLLCNIRNSDGSISCSCRSSKTFRGRTDITCECNEQVRREEEI